MGEFALTKIQYGLEATDAAGTAVAADTILPAVHPPISPDRIPRFVEESLGVRAESMRQFTGQYLAQDTLSFPDAYFQVLPVLFSCGIKGNISPSNDSGAYTWDFGPNMTTTNDLNTVTLELGDDTQAYECEYTLFRRYRIAGTINQGAEASPVEVEADYFARQYTPTTFTSLGLDSDLPSSDLEPINAKLVQFYIDTSWAGVGGSEKSSLLRGFDVEILTGVHPKFFGDSDKFFSVHGEGKFAVMGAFTFEGSSDADDIFDLFQAGTMSVVRLKVASGDIAGTPHSLTFDMSGYWENVIPLAEQSEGNNLHTAMLHGTYDTTGSKLFDLEVITDVAAI